jgi:hypothetical protein
VLNGTGQFSTPKVPGHDRPVLHWPGRTGWSARCVLVPRCQELGAFGHVAQSRQSQQPSRRRVAGRNCAPADHLQNARTPPAHRSPASARSTGMPGRPAARSYVVYDTSRPVGRSLPRDGSGGSWPGAPSGSCTDHGWTAGGGRLGASRRANPQDSGSGPLKGLRNALPGVEITCSRGAMMQEGVAELPTGPTDQPGHRWARCAGAVPGRRRRPPR